MTRFLIGFLVGLTLGSLAQGQTPDNSNSAEQTFVEGGTVWLRLSSGDYAVRGAGSDHIAVRWFAEDSAYEADMKRIKTYIDLSSTTATIRTEGPTKHARFTIDVPARSNLHLRMRAGDVYIGGVEGNKDVRMTAGDLRIDVLPTAYSLVHGSVTFGDVRAHPLGISKGGIARSFNWTGSGKYTLHASLFAGDLTFSQGRTEQ